MSVVWMKRQKKWHTITAVSGSWFPSLVTFDRPGAPSFHDRIGELQSYIFPWAIFPLRALHCRNRWPLLLKHPSQILQWVDRDLWHFFRHHSWNFQTGISKFLDKDKENSGQEFWNFWTIQGNLQFWICWTGFWNFLKGTLKQRKIDLKTQTWWQNSNMFVWWLRLMVFMCQIFQKLFSFRQLINPSQKWRVPADSFWGFFRPNGPSWRNTAQFATQTSSKKILCIDFVRIWDKIIDFGGTAKKIRFLWFVMCVFFGASEIFEILKKIKQV